MATKCPKCDTVNPVDSKYCKECATSLTGAEEIQPSFTKTLEIPIEELTRGTLFADRYQIIEKLGTGGMGAVYRVEDTNIGLDIALKLIKSDIASDKKSIERFRNELKTTRMISHRNVCRMFDLAEIEDTYYITMEYVPGEDLKSFIRRSGRLDIPKAMSIAEEICEGLSEAHRLGVVHRDLKSNNIMIDKEGNARIMDFGIALSHRTKGVTGEGIIIGTPEYMSPEQAEAREVDHRSDIYSLGVILYEMTTGQLPFEGGTSLSIAMKHKSEEPANPREHNPNIPEDLCQLLLKCLSKEKSDRYQSAEDLRSELIRIEKSITKTKKIIPLKKPIAERNITDKLSKKRLFAFALSFFAIVAVIVISGYFVYRQLSKKPIPPTHTQLTFTGNASYPAISPDGKFIAYVNKSTFGEQVIIIKDINSGHTNEIFRAKWFMYTLRWTPDGSEISFFAMLKNGIRNTILVPWLGGPARTLVDFPYFAWSPDGSQYAGTWRPWKEIKIIDKTTEDSRSLTIGGSFEGLIGIDWSPIGDFLLFLTIDKEDRYAIWTIATDGTKQRMIIKDSSPIYSPRWSPRGDAILYIRSGEHGKELWKIPVSSVTGKTTKSASFVTSLLQAGTYLSIADNGKKLLYTRQLSYSNLWLATVQGSGKEMSAETKQLTSGTLVHQSPSISPDGNSIAFSKRGNIYVMPKEGGTPTQLTYMDSYNFSPVWSPDGMEIAFISTKGKTTTVWKISAKGGKPHQFVRSESCENAYAAWSPGENILYPRPGNRNFHILNPKTEEEMPLVEDDSIGWMFYPEYSQDGGKVAVFYNRKIRGIYVISLTDSSQLLVKKGENRPIGWSSDGKWVYSYEILGPTVRIFRHEVEGNREKTVISIPFTFELGQPGIVKMSPDFKHYIIRVYKSNSDVWIVENFDPDIN